MDKYKQLFESVFKIGALENAEDNLHQVTRKYPYFSIAQFYLLHLMSERGAARQLQARKTGLLFNNNYWLNFQLQTLPATVTEAMANANNFLAKTVSTESLPIATTAADRSLIVAPTFEIPDAISQPQDESLAGKEDVSIITENSIPFRKEAVNTDNSITSTAELNTEFADEKLPDDMFEQSTAVVPVISDSEQLPVKVQTTAIALTEVENKNAVGNQVETEERTFIPDTHHPEYPAVIITELSTATITPFVPRPVEALIAPLEVIAPLPIELVEETHQASEIPTHPIEEIVITELQPAVETNDDEQIPDGKEINEPALPALNLNFKTRVSNTGEEMLFEPLHTTDYFASLGIKLSEQVVATDKLSKQLKSFTEWLKTMKKIHSEQLTGGEIISATTDTNIQQLAEQSNQDDTVITEAMADVLMQQGRTKKAIQVLEKLSLLNPGKSAYFAAKINQLKEL